MQQKKHQRFIELMNLIESEAPSERGLASKLGVANTDVRRWKRGVGSPDIEVFEAAAKALGWSMDRVVAFLNNQELPTSPSKEQIIAFLKEMTLAEVMEVVEAGITRLSEAKKKGVLLEVDMNELARLIREEMIKRNLDEAGFARKVKMSASVLRQILQGEIPGNAKTKLGNLAANLTHPGGKRKFTDWEELARYCAIDDEAEEEDLETREAVNCHSS